MLARFAPRLARTAWTAPRRALPSLAATRTAAPAAPALRTLTTTAPLAKKKKGGEKAAAAEPPADVEGQLDLDALNEKMNKTVAWCADAVQTLVGSLGRVDACTLAPPLTQRSWTRSVYSTARMPSPRRCTTTRRSACATTA